MTYRPDIDGLRTVAVSLVVFAHFGFESFTGGFIGVDVFFVISGYLITRLILREIEKNRFSILAFYVRRVKRILPALLVVTSASLILGWVLLLPADFELLGVQAAFASFGVSNVYFWTEAGYFGREAEKLPLLHTWSLGVEEQFYLIWPIIAIASLVWFKTGRRTLLAAITSLTLASFAAMLWISARDVDFAFYMLPTRAWQLGVGAIVAFAPSIQRGVIAFAFDILGLTLIALSMVLISEKVEYPNVLAVLPTLGAALLVAPKTHVSVVNRLLSTSHMVALGRASYSIYLWHWPILVFFVFWNNGLNPTLIEAGCLIFLTLGLSALSFRYVETPIRKASWGGLTTIGTGLAVSGFLAILGLWTWYEGGSQYRLSESDRTVAAHMEKPRTRPDRPACNIARGGKEFSSTCITDTRYGPAILYLGDSHANHMIPSARQKFRDVYFHRATSVHCLPTLNSSVTHNSPAAQECVAYYRAMFDNHIPSNPYETVIIHARWRSGKWKNIKETVSYLKQLGSRVIVIGPTTEYSDDLPQILLQFAVPRRRIVSTNQFLSRFKEIKLIDSAMKDMVLQAGGEYYSVLQTLCDETGCSPTTPSGIPISWDYGHFTTPGATYLLEKFREEGLRLP